MTLYSWTDHSGYVYFDTHMPEWSVVMKEFTSNLRPLFWVRGTDFPDLVGPIHSVRTIGINIDILGETILTRKERKHAH